MVIGGYAINFYCRPRFTADIDFFISKSHNNAQKIINTLQDFGFGSLNLTIEDFLKPGQIVQLGFEPVRIDIVNNIPAVDFDEAYSRRVIANVDQVQIHFISLQDLKLNKLAAGRNKDLDDVNAIEKLEKALAKKKNRRK
jgi:hypothetical protein